MQSDKAAYIESVGEDGSSLCEDQQVLLVSGRDEINLNVALSTKIMTIQGSVRAWNGEGEQGEVLAQSQRSGQFYTVATDANGKFTITGLGPGDYSLYAWHSLSNVAYANPQFLRRYQLDRVNVVLREGADVGEIKIDVLSDDR